MENNGTQSQLLIRFEDVVVLCVIEPKLKPEFYGCVTVGFLSHQNQVVSDFLWLNMSSACQYLYVSVSCGNAERYRAFLFRLLNYLLHAILILKTHLEEF